MDAQLDERKVTILKAIIKTYLETGEPVGSRTISKYSELKLSSATIRNEMSDLEEMGYIIQPHTSAGRIPSDKGYRFYVDQIMQEKENEVTEFKDVMVQKVDKLELVLKKMAQALAANTNYAAMISGPSYHKTKLKFIQLSRVEANKLLVVVVVEGNIIKNKILTVDELVEEEEVVKLNLLLNTYLQGLSLQEINMELLQTMKRQAQGHRKIIGDLIDTIVEAIQEEDDTEIYTSGTTNLLKYPELADREKAGQLLYTLEEKQGLNELITAGENDENKHGIQVYIGSESPVQSMKDCSIVTATYELEEGVQGTIGIIGPKRMDYKKVVNNLETVMTQLDTIFKKDKKE